MVVKTLFSYLNREVLVSLAVSDKRLYKDHGIKVNHNWIYTCFLKENEENKEEESFSSQTVSFLKRWITSMKFFGSEPSWGVFYSKGKLRQHIMFKYLKNASKSSFSSEKWLHLIVDGL